MGSRAKACIGKSLLVEGLPCIVRPACIHTGIPFCQWCCKWDHSTTACKSPHVVCPICLGPHRKENHRALASCCKSNPSANPPIPPTPEGEPCSHSHVCINCWDKSHPATLLAAISASINPWYGPLCLRCAKGRLSRQMCCLSFQVFSSLHLLFFCS